MLLFFLFVSPARRAPHSNQATIGFTSLSVPLTGDRNPSRKGKDVTALRCSEPLRSKVGGASKPSPWLCGMGPPGDELGLSLDRLAYKDGYNDYMMLVLW